MSKLNHDSKLLITSYCISSIGDWLNILALMSLVITISDKKEILAILMIMRALPKILFGPIVSGIIDRLNKKVTLIVVSLTSSVIVFFIPYSFSNIYLILLLSFLLSLINIFMSPMIYSIIPLITEKDNILFVDTIFNSFSSAIGIFAPIVSGLILTLSNLSISFYVDSISFIIFSIFILYLKINEKSNLNLNNKYKFKDVLENSKKNYNYIVNNNSLYRIFKGIFLVNMSMGIIYVCEIIYLKNAINMDPNMYGMFVSIVGVGIIIGSILINKLKMYKSYDLFSFGIYIMGISIILFSFSNNIFIIITCLVIEGIGESFFTTLSINIIQSCTSEKNRTSILTFNDSVSKSAYILSMGIAGLLIVRINVGLIVLSAGILSALYYFIWLKEKNIIEDNTLS